MLPFSFASGMPNGAKLGSDYVGFAGSSPEVGNPTSFLPGMVIGDNDTNLLPTLQEKGSPVLCLVNILNLVVQQFMGRYPDRIF